MHIIQMNTSGIRSLPSKRQIEKAPHKSPFSWNCFPAANLLLPPMSCHIKDQTKVLFIQSARKLYFSIYLNLFRPVHKKRRSEGNICFQNIFQIPIVMLQVIKGAFFRQGSELRVYYSMNNVRVSYIRFSFGSMLDIEICGEKCFR